MPKAKQGYDVKVIATVALVFVVTVFVLVLGGTLLDDVQDSQIETTSTSYANVTMSSVTEVPQTLTYTDTAFFSSISGVTVTNATVGTLVGSANYSVVSGQNGATIVFTGDDTNWNNTNLNVSYTVSYIDADTQFNTTNYGMESLTEFSDWLPTLALIIIAAVIIGVIIRYFSV